MPTLLPLRKRPLRRAPTVAVAVTLGVALPAQFAVACSSPAHGSPAHGRPAHSTSLRPINGVGLESHFILGELPGDIQANMERFAKLGVDTAVTELDVRMPLPPTDDQLAQQATDFSSATNACLAVGRCVGITVWGFDDGHSWVPGVFAGHGASTPYAADYQTKPAYDGLADSLAADSRQH